MEKKYQLCFLCNSRTGRTGSEDSLYDDDNGSGPKMHLEKYNNAKTLITLKTQEDK